MRRSVIGMMILLALSKVTGLLRTIVISRAYGAGEISDIFFASVMIPGVFLGIVLAGINTCLVPVLTMAEKNGDKDEFFNRFISLMLVISGLVIVLIISLAHPLAGLVSSFKGDKLYLVGYYTKFTSVIAGLQILTYTMVGYLQQNNRYFIPAAIAIPMNFINIIGISIWGYKGLGFLIAITIVGYLSQLIWVLIPFIKEGYEYKFDIRLKDEYLSYFLVLIGPIMLTTSASQLNLTIDANLASSLDAGSLSLVNYSGLVYGVFVSVLAMSFSTVLFTKQSDLFMDNDHYGLCCVTRDNLSVLMMLIIPLTFGVLFLSREIMELLYYRGSMTLKDIDIMGWLLFIYSLTLAGWSINDVMGKFLISVGESRKTVLPSLLNIGTNIILNLIFIRFWGVYGLALASSIASYVAVAASIARTRSYFKEVKVSIFTMSLFKYVVAGLSMLLVLFIVKALTAIDHLPLLVYILVVALIGIAVYFAVLLALQTKEVIDVKQRLVLKIKGN